MSAKQRRVQIASSVSQLPDCLITEAKPEPRRTLGSAATSSEAGGNDQHDSEGTKGVSTSQWAQAGATGNRHEWQAESVGKLFDKELDNHHEEKLLLAQVATGLMSPQVTPLNLHCSQLHSACKLWCSQSLGSSLSCPCWLVFSGCSLRLMRQSFLPKAFAQQLSA